MKISEHANYLLNEYGRLQFDYAAYCKPYGESLRNEARNNLEEYIAELEDAQRWVSVQRRELLDEVEKADAAYADAFEAYRDVLDVLNEHHLNRVPEAKALMEHLGKDYRAAYQELKRVEAEL